MAQHYKIENWKDQKWYSKLMKRVKWILKYSSGNASSDMFDGIKKAVFVVKPITTDGKILPTVETLKELNQVKQYMKGV